MTRWMFPYIGIISLVSLSAGVLNTWKRFVVPAATPVLLNCPGSPLAGGCRRIWQGWGYPPIYALAAA
jgi:putative peptidoglycan lipid II flippase